MPDIHVPKLDGHGGGKSIFKLILEVSLIGVGVFLGLAGEQWRERAHQRELAEQALRRFRTEITENRKSVAAVAEYHAARLAELRSVLAMPPAKRTMDGVHFSGLRPERFERSAWDLALATQSLAYIDPDLGFALSNAYNVQGAIGDLGRQLTQAMYISPPTEDANTTKFFGGVLIYFSDLSIYEPELLKMYDEILPRIDKALQK